jgi:hypothetical protein
MLKEVVKTSSELFTQLRDVILSPFRARNFPVFSSANENFERKSQTTEENTEESATESNSVASDTNDDSLSLSPMPEIFMSKLRTGIKPVIYATESASEKYSFKACYNQLIMIEKIMVAFLDKIPCENAKQSAQYTKNKKNIQRLRTAYEHLLKIPAPQNISEYPAYSTQITPLIERIKHCMNTLESNIGDRKSFILSRFYVGYLRTLSKTYLFNAHSQSSESEAPYFEHERTETENRVSSLIYKHKSNPLYQEATPNLLELFQMIHSHEQRVVIEQKKRHKCKNKDFQNTQDICQSLTSSIQIEKTLNQLKIASLDILLHLIEKPNKHLPTSSYHEKNTQLQDLIFFKKPAEYKFLLKTSPKMLKELVKSFAFTNEFINDFFSKPRGFGALQKDKVLVAKLVEIIKQKKHELNQQDEDTYSDISDLESDFGDDFWENSATASKIAEELPMPPLSNLELIKKIGSSISPVEYGEEDLIQAHKLRRECSFNCVKR